MTTTQKPTGLCWVAANRPPAGTPSLWDGRWHRESTDEVKLRHQAARLACAQCPRLEGCEKALSEFEELGIAIDGVMAGRYCDVGLWWTRGRPELAMFLQTNCRACGEEMRPRVPGKLAKYTTDRRHVGEGMCDKCFPVFSRAARRGAA